MVGLALWGLGSFMRNIKPKKILSKYQLSLVCSFVFLLIFLILSACRGDMGELDNGLRSSLTTISFEDIGNVAGRSGSPLSSSEIEELQNDREIQDRINELRDKIDIFQNPEGRDRRPRWPRRGYVFRIERYVEGLLRLGVKTSLNKPLSNLSLAIGTIDFNKRVGIETYTELEFKVVRRSDFEIIGTNVKSMLDYNDQGQVVFTNIPPGDVVALCEEMVYLQRKADLVGRLNYLGQRGELTGGKESRVEATQTTGMLPVENGQLLSYYMDACDKRFRPNVVWDLVEDLKKQANVRLFFDHDDKSTCVIPHPSKDYMDLMGFRTLREFKASANLSDRGCEAYAGDKVVIWKLKQDTILGRCVHKEGLPSHAGYCESRTIEGQPCPLFKNVDGTITGFAKSKDSKQVTYQPFERFCDERQNLRCVMTQKGGWFTLELPIHKAIYKRYLARCEKIPDSERDKGYQSGQRHADWVTKEPLVHESSSKGGLKLLSERKIAKLLRVRSKFEASGVTYVPSIDSAFVVSDNKKTIVKLTYDTISDEFEGRQLNVRATADSKISVPMKCVWCSNVSINMWRYKVKGFEGITHNRQLAEKTDRLVFYAAIESLNVSKDKANKSWMPAVAELEYIPPSMGGGRSGTDDGYFQLNNLIILDYRFRAKTGRNRGIEGVYHTADAAGQEYLFTLCEGRQCSSAKYARNKSGQLLFFSKLFTRKNNVPVWKYEGNLNLDIPNFTDFSGVDINEQGIVAVLSQESSRIWFGKFYPKSFIIKPMGQYNFPYSAKNEFTYCNVEGVAWVSRNRFVVVSDEIKFNAKKKNKYKGRIKVNCAAKQQSIHVFQSPQELEQIELNLDNAELPK